MLVILSLTHWFLFHSWVRLRPRSCSFSRSVTVKANSSLPSAKRHGAWTHMGSNPSCVALGKSLDLSELPFHFLWSRAICLAVARLESKSEYEHTLQAESPTQTAGLSGRFPSALSGGGGKVALGGLFLEGQFFPGQAYGAGVEPQLMGKNLLFTLGFPRKTLPLTSRSSWLVFSGQTGHL